MGLYDHIRISIACFNCGQQLTDWQTKDGPCAMQNLLLTDIPAGTFYGICHPNIGCGAWNEYKVDINYYADAGIPDASIQLAGVHIAWERNKVANIITLTRVQDRALSRQPAIPGRPLRGLPVDQVLIDEFEPRPRVEDGRLLHPPGGDHG